MNLLSRSKLKNIIGGGPGDPESVPSEAGGCSVTCTTGYFACCSSGLISPDCSCVPTNKTASCDNGGKGSTSCSVTV